MMPVPQDAETTAAAATVVETPLPPPPVTPVVEGGAAPVPTVTIPEEELLAMQRDQEELQRRRSEATRERGRTRKARADLRQARTAEPEVVQPTLTAETIAEAMVKALGQARPAEKRPAIPGLKFESNGEVTYQGRPIDPDVAEILVQSRQEGETLRETVQRLETHQAEIDERLAGEDSEREAATMRVLEERHIARLEDYGVSLADQAFSHLDDGMKEVARENYYANLSRVLNGLNERGMKPEEVTPELIARISTPIIERLSQRLGGAETRAQAVVNAEARETQPLSRGGSVAEPGRPDLDKMTPEQREVEIDKLAGELAALHAVSSTKTQAEAASRRRAY